MKFKKILLIILCLLLSNGVMVSAAQTNDKQQTQLEKRQFQTRSYEGISQTIAMKAMLNVLQDEGYIVDNANPLLGFIAGNKEINANGKKGSIICQTEATVNVTEIGKNVKIRINIKEKWINAYGNAQDIVELQDEKGYQELFAKVDKALFIAKQGL